MRDVLKIGFIIVAACTLAMVLIGQTTVSLDNIRTVPGSVLVWVDNALRGANLQGLEIDSSVDPPVLRVVAQPNLPDFKVLTYQPTGSQTAFDITDEYWPGSLEVYRNGLRMADGLDYQPTNNGVGFYPPQVPQAGDIILLCYIRMQ